jgi:hypothetical protein
VQGDNTERILATCRASQEATDRKKQTYGNDYQALATLLSEPEPHRTFWKGYLDRIEGPTAIEDASFKNCLFAQVAFMDHTFRNCDFSDSRWAFASLKNSNCSGSNFSNAKMLFSNFISTNCSGCNFSGSTFMGFNFCTGNDFSGADFSGARLESFYILFNNPKILDKASRFTGANMTGCQLVVKKDKRSKTRVIRGLLERVFTVEQLAVMDIDYGTGSSASAARPRKAAPQTPGPTAAFSFLKHPAFLLLLVGIFVVAIYLFSR